MTKAYAVIGGNYGDEGKGLITDFLAHQLQQEGQPVIVVRFNGGAQAGHTVLHPDTEKRTVFHHFCAGTFAGGITYFGPEFILNPVMYHRERIRLERRMGWAPPVYSHPHAIVSTFHDMILNQLIETSRGNDVHGSCGLGIQEALLRSQDPMFRIQAKDMFDPKSLGERMAWITYSYVPKRLRELGLGEEYVANFMAPHLIKDFSEGAEAMESGMAIRSTDVFADHAVIFEGAQGLLLDKNNTGDYPHLTPSNTGLDNVMSLLHKAPGIDELEVVYVTRTYLTRHGAGPLPNEDPEMSYPDETNKPNPWQGGLRFAPQDWKAFGARVYKDFQKTKLEPKIESKFGVAATCADQLDVNPNKIPYLTYSSHGPRRQDIRVIKEAECASES